MCRYIGSIAIYQIVLFHHKFYFEYMHDVAVVLGADKVKAKEQMLEALNFEMKIANISLPR